MSTHTGSRVRDAIIAVMGLALVATVAFGIDEGTSKDPRRHHVTFPEIDPTVGAGCTAEAAAYASALANLEDAEEAAADAYDAWMDCEMGGQSVEIDLSQIPTQSVLVRQ